MAPTEGTPVTILGRDTCEDTVRCLALLQRHGVAYTYRHVDEDAQADAWIRRLNGGGWVTPTILIGDPERPDQILREPTNHDLEAALGLA
jgi:glutaredoxin